MKSSAKNESNLYEWDGSYKESRQYNTRETYRKISPRKTIIEIIKSIKEDK